MPLQRSQSLLQLGSGAEASPPRAVRRAARRQEPRRHSVGLKLDGDDGGDSDSSTAGSPGPWPPLPGPQVPVLDLNSPRARRPTLSRRGSVSDVPSVQLDRAFWSTVRLQAQWKRRQAQARASEILEWKLWNDLEGRNEADIVKLSGFLNRLTALTRRVGSPASSASSASSSSSSSDSSSSSFDSSYELRVDLLRGAELPDTVPHLPSPLTEAGLHQLLDLVRRTEPLPLVFLCQVVEEARVAMLQQPNVVSLSVAPAGRLTVVGDLHGQLFDLLHIFDENGLPGPDNPYVFNGDFVDRGDYSCEVLVLVLALRVVFPGAVHVNRGNHEDREITKAYGFEAEIVRKYPDSSAAVYDLCLHCFAAMPLACVVDGSALVLHGGLFHRDGVTLSEIQALPRQDFCAMQGPDAAEDTEENKLIGDILWSDPQRKPGREPSYRGMGCKFGPDVARAFLDENGLRLLVRSHECVREGAEWPFEPDGGVLTVFSCSSYCGAYNKGAYAVFDADLQPQLHKYKVRPPRPDRQRKKMEEANRQHLGSLIAASGAALLASFRAADTTFSGRVSRLDWAATMRRVLHLDLPWLRLQPQLVQTDAEGMLHYESFLGDLAALEGQVSVDRLYRNGARLESIFAFFDEDGDGAISKEQFCDGCFRLNEMLPPEEQLYDVATVVDMIDLSGDAQITINEFMECVRLVQQRSAAS